KGVPAGLRSAAGQGSEPTLLNAVEQVNERQKSHRFELMSAHYNGKLSGKTSSLWGLAFKPNTDDMRAAASRRLMELLWDAGASVRAYDPEACDEARRIYGDRQDLVLCGRGGEALGGADAGVVLTEWRDYRTPSFAHLASVLRDGVVFDGRNFYEPAEVESHGLAYYGIGRGRSVRAVESEAVPSLLQSIAGRVEAPAL